MSLKRELERPGSPIRVFFDDRLPELKRTRATYKAALAGASTTLPTAVEGGSPLPTPVPADVLGHAISARFLWDLEPPPPPAEVRAVMTIRSGRIAGQFASVLEYQFGQPPETVAAFSALLDEGPNAAGPDVAARVAWIGGLLDRAARVYPDPEDRWFGPLFETGSCEQLLGSVPDWAVADIVTVHDRCADHLAGLAGEQVVVAPTFAGSIAIGGADADFIAGGALIDVKAIKDPALKARDLRQIVAYALLDWTDSYGIDTVGILAARQGVLVTWPLDELLTEMAGATVTPAELREGLRTALGTPNQ